MQSICHLIYILIYSLYYSANRVKGDNRCYVCSNMDVKNVVAHIQDTKWKSWLSRAATDPKINDCNDNFNAAVALRSGAKSLECEAGACLKLLIKEKAGGSFVWRSCLANSTTQTRSDCTRVTTGTGELEICTCFGNLCNTSSKITINLFTVLVTLFLSLINV